MYTYEQKKKAVDLFIQYDLSPAAVRHELGYPSKNMIYNWYHEYIETGTISDPKEKPRKYTKEQREKAVKYYLEHGKSISKTIDALGYPKKTTLGEWLNEDLDDSQRKLYYKRTSTLTRIPPEKKELAVQEYLSGKKRPAQIARELNVEPGTIYQWRDKLLGKKNMKKIKDNNLSSKLPDNVSDLQDEIHKLTKEAEQLKKQVFQLQLERNILEKAAEIIKKGQGISLEKLTNREKAELIDALRDKYRLQILLKSLNISKSSYFYQANALKRPDKYYDLRSLIIDIFDNSKGTYGYRRVHMELKNKTRTVSEKVVKRIMREAGLIVKQPKIKKYNSYKGEISPAVPNIIDRDFHADAPNEKWLTDITEFHIPAGKIYLSPIIDCFDGAAVSWTIGISPNADLVNSMLDSAIKTLQENEKPIVHSDRGAHYRWAGWISRMEQSGLIRSMSKKGCSPDNSACEGFFGRLKNEMFYLRDWSDTTIEQFIEKLDTYIHWYNEKRIKLSLGGKSPMQYRQSLGLVI